MPPAVPPVICAWNGMPACDRNPPRRAQIKECSWWSRLAGKTERSFGGMLNGRALEQGVDAANKSRARHGAPCTRRVSRQADHATHPSQRKEV